MLKPALHHVKYYANVFLKIVKISGSLRLVNGEISKIIKIKQLTATYSHLCASNM